MGKLLSQGRKLIEEEDTGEKYHASMNLREITSLVIGLKIKCSMKSMIL